MDRSVDLSPFPPLLLLLLLLSFPPAGTERAASLLALPKETTSAFLFRRLFMVCLLLSCQDHHSFVIMIQPTMRGSLKVCLFLLPHSRIDLFRSLSSHSAM